MSDLDLHGNAYWELVRDGNGDLVEIYRLPPHKMKIVPDPKEYITGFLFEVSDKKKIAFLRDDVAHFKSYNPADEYYGLSPLRAGKLAVETQVFGARWNKQLLKASAVPGGLIYTEDPAGPDSRIQIRKEWEDLTAGVERSHSVVVVPHGLRYEQVEMKPSDVGFLEGMKFNREEIAAIYGVPPVILNLSTPNFATAREENLIFWEGTMRPLLRKWANRIDHSVLPEEAFCAFDLSQVSVFEEMRFQKTDEVTALHAGGLISTNEGRIELGFPLTEDGNSRYMPMSQVEVGEAPAPVVTRSVSYLYDKAMALQPSLPWYMIRASQLPRRERKKDVVMMEERLKAFAELVEARFTKEGYPKLTA